MSLRERLKNKKEAKAIKKAAIEAGEFKISIEKVCSAVSRMKNPADIGNIVKEFAKFLSTLQTQDAQVLFKGNFDLGQRTLLSCMLSGFLDDGKSNMNSVTPETSQEENQIEQENPPKLIRKRRTVKQRLAEKAESED